MRTADKQDDAQVIQVVNFLKDLGFDNIKRDWFLLFDKTEFAYFHKEHVTEQEAKTYKVLRPDIYISGQGANALVIEVDGSIHDTPSGQKRSRKRNETYAIYGLSYIVINFSDLKLMQMSWEYYLKSELKKMKFIKQ